MRFEFATATRIVFGAGSVRELGSIARELGQHALLVTGSDPCRATQALQRDSSNLRVTVCAVAGEPSTEDATRATAIAREAGCDYVIGFGGGGALDTAKAVSALLTNAGDLFDYLEIIGRGQALTRPAAPCICIPTTAGTGAEVTRNAVLTSQAHEVKVSLRSPLMLPRVALIDPELTYSLPPEITASTGLDALTQLIEPFLSSRANPLTDALCTDGLVRIARSLRRAVSEPKNPTARYDMALGSLLGGLALANAGLGAVHGFAGPIGGKFAAPHGAVCAALLPGVLEGNLQAITQRGGPHPAAERFDQLARLLTGHPNASARDAIAWVAQLVTDLRIPKLSSHGVTEDHVEGLAVAAANSSSMKGNPVRLTTEELKSALRAAL